MSDRGVERIAAGELDVAVIASWALPPEPPPHLTVHTLLRDPMVIVLPDDHPLVTGSPDGTPLRLEQLRDESWVTILAGHAAREQLDRAAIGAGFTPRIRFQTASYDLAQALVGTGYGVALVSRLALTRVPGTTHRPLADPPLHRDLHAVTRSDTALTPLADVFRTLLLDVATDLRGIWSSQG
ncbi:LysR substrate-binding domain-containing protein [Streptomyces hyaluromycini]|uniref:LysR substrate-binding domain-containing protein n=1 Tax=Streptomyces hyaluromycini TaxID=1377993 RepID=UPI000B5C8342|nr:LysR substrate-binding domain-containing protein [Streptomyces hyaluromycini]